MSLEAVRVVPFQLEHIPSIIRIYREVTNPTYIAYGEIEQGFSDMESFHPHADQLFRDEIRQMLENPTSFLFVALERNHQVIGFISGDLEVAPADFSVCWIKDFGVSSNFQRKGVGGVLLSAVEQWAISRNAEYVCLESGISNTSAHHFFENHQFKPLSKTFIRRIQTTL